MSKITIEQRIARCIDIQHQIAQLKNEEDDHKAFLVIEAEADPELHSPTDGGGWSCTFLDAQGNAARVTQPAPALKNKINSEKVLGKIQDVAGESFRKLFKKIESYKPVEEFRIQALALLEAKEARKLIALMTTKSAVTVNFEVKEGA
jgi:hypothetical protein